MNIKLSTARWEMTISSGAIYYSAFVDTIAKQSCLITSNRESQMMKEGLEATYFYIY